MADLERRILEDEARASHARHYAAFDPLPFSTQDVRKEIKRSRNARSRKVVFAVVVLLLAVLVAVACLVFKFPSHLHTVESAAMVPTIEQNQVVFVQDGEPAHVGDVVMYRTVSGETQFKRVIAVPGEWVGVTDDKQIALSDKTMEKGAIVEREGDDAVIVACTKLPENTYFLLGDAESVSKGVLDAPENIALAEQIQGRASFKVWPFPNVGPIS